MAEPTDDKNSEHGARTGFAAGSFGSPEEAPADTVMQPFVMGTDDASNQVVIRQTEAARRRFIDIINSEPSAGTNFGEARTHAAPIAASLTLSGTTPVVVQNAVKSPAAASLALSGATPTVVQNVQAVPAAASLALSGSPPAAGSFSSPEEAPADTVMQRPPNLVLAAGSALSVSHGSAALR